jgi:hypothetical protein
MPEASLREYQALVSKYAAQFGVPYHLALAILETESNYRPRAESPKGAKGLFQIMPVISARYGVTDPFDPEQNIRAGVEHLGVLLRKYGDETLAAAAYNAGEPKVDDARGVPAIPETQQYVQKVAAAQTRLGTEPETGAPRAQEAPMAQESQFYERWIYPTRRHGGGTGGIGSETDEFRDGDGVPLDEKDPEREGILVSWEGSPNDGPKPNEIRQIFQEVDPGGVITAQDASDLAALGTSTGVGTARFLARRLRGILGTAARRTVTAGRFVPGGQALPLLVGLTASLGQAYSASQVPKEVGRFAIESWPRSRYGMQYEGAPDTPLEYAHSMAVAGGQELLGEGIGGSVAALPRRLGQWWGSSGFPKTLLQAMDARRASGQQGVARTLAETRTLPTIASSKRAADAGAAASAADDAILQSAQDKLGPISVNLTDVLKDARGTLEGSVDHLKYREMLNLPGLGNEWRDTVIKLMDSWSSPTRIGGATIKGTMRDVPLGEANRLRREANQAARTFWNQAGKVMESPPSHVAAVQKALGRAFRDNIQKSLATAERTRKGTGDRIRTMARRGVGRRFADRWRNQVDYASEWYASRDLAKAGAATPLGGLLAGALAFGAPTAVGSFLGNPGLGLGTGAALAQLTPLGRTLTGLGIRQGAGAATMAPVQAARALHIRGGPDPPPYQRTPTVNFESFGLGPAVERLRNWRPLPHGPDRLRRLR